MRKKTLKTIIVGFSVLVGVLSASADNTPTHIIVLGSGGDKVCYPLSDYNRIAFSSDGIVLSSSKDTSVEQITLLYAAYNHIQFGDNLSVENILSDNSEISYEPSTGSLRLSVASPQEFVVGVFSTSGVLVAAGHPASDGIFAVSNLPQGIYVAVACGGRDKMTLKFQIK